jgi:hypothetical protein
MELANRGTLREEIHKKGKGPASSESDRPKLQKNTDAAPLGTDGTASVGWWGSSFSCLGELARIREPFSVRPLLR